MEQRPFHILISSAGRRVGLMQAFRQTLLEMDLSGEVLAADMSMTAPAYHLADRSFIVPPCSAHDFVPTMLEICAQNDVRLLIPTLDTELPIYAAHREAFASVGTMIAISSPEVIAIANNKHKTHAWLTANGFSTVQQALVPVFLESHPWEYPVIVKPASGSMSKGVAIVYGDDELRLATRGDDFIVQSIATGNEYTVSLYANREGICRSAVPRRRLEVRGGEVSKGMTVRNSVIESLAMELCSRLPGAFGALNVQIFYDDATGQAKVIELNPRFGGGCPLALQAGANSTRWLIEEALGLASTATNELWKDRFLMLRYDSAVYLTEEQFNEAGEVHRLRHRRHVVS